MVHFSPLNRSSYIPSQTPGVQNGQNLQLSQAGDDFLFSSDNDADVDIDLVDGGDVISQPDAQTTQGLGGWILKGIGKLIQYLGKENSFYLGGLLTGLAAGKSDNKAEKAEKTEVENKDKPQPNKNEKDNKPNKSK